MKPPKGPSGPGPRIALRNWRISTRLVSLLALPVVAATSLGALRINDSMDDIQQLDNMKLLTDMTKQATELAAALQEERDQSAGPLAHGGKATDFTVKGYRDKTDRADEELPGQPPRRSTAPARTATSRASARTSCSSSGDLGDLEKIRKRRLRVQGQLHADGRGATTV